MYTLRVAAYTFLFVNGFLNILPSDCSSGYSRSCRPNIPLSDALVMKDLNKKSVQTCDMKAQFVKISRVPNNINDHDFIRKYTAFNLKFKKRRFRIFLEID